MKKVLAAAFLVLAGATVSRADCTLYNVYTTAGGQVRGSWSCEDYRGNYYDVDMELWRGLMDLGY
jgi:hypothetical protein